MASNEDIGPVGPYQYSSLPLNHIRLLQLEPSSDSSRALRCTLSDFDLQSSDIPYDALSYVWGPPVFDHDLYLGDKAQLKITSSLHGALKRLRRDSQPRRIWADAVCINQASDEEKRVQIPLMRDIYQGAHAVMVWLGEGDQAASALHQLSLRARRLTVPGFGMQSTETVLATELVDEILRLPWFKRRWVIQEVVLNANVLFCAGTTAELNWTKLVASVIRCYPNAASRLNYDSIMVHESQPGPQGEVNSADGSARAQSSVKRMFELWKERALPLPPHTNYTKCGLLALLNEFDDNACSDGKDRIYALTGLANDVSVRSDSDTPYLPHGLPSQISIRISYDQSTESAYIRFAEDLISSGRVSWLLEQAISRRPTLLSRRNLPYWVPDWRIKPYGTYYDLYSSQRLNQSSYETLPLVGGSNFDRHVISIEIWPWNHLDQAMDQIYRPWSDSQSAPVFTDPTQQALPSIFWRSEYWPCLRNVQISREVTRIGYLSRTKELSKYLS
ncbi:HET-domain-containing protein [Apiospora sp. TS-2023a]